jgi:hypothetical protein
MSSWANRHLPRKRDISQIPEALRPHIVPRAEQPQVVISETFQFKPVNEIVYPSKGRNEPVDSRPSFIRRLEPAPQPAAKELTHDGASYVFVILRHLRNSKDNDLWISSYHSIRKFYTNKIIIIDDNSTVNTVNGKLFNTEIIMSDWNGAGELLPYYYFLQNKWADRMIFLHDSMFLNRPFRPSELEGPVRFHWHFSKAAKADKRVLTYLSLLSESDDVAEFAATSRWYGCFGGASIISWDTVQQLEERYSLCTQLILSVRTRSDREAVERVLGILLFYEGIVEETSCSNFGDILEYPGAFESQNNNAETAAHVLNQNGYDSAILKVWRGR